MNPIAEEIFSYFSDDDYLSHEGVSVLDGAPGRGSGRGRFATETEAFQRLRANYLKFF